MKSLYMILISLLFPLISYGSLGETVEQESNHFKTKPALTKKIDSRLTEILWDEQGFIRVIGFLDGVSVFQREAYVDDRSISEANLQSTLDSYAPHWMVVESTHTHLKIWVSEDAKYAATYGEESGVGKHIFTIMSYQYLEYLSKKNSTITI